MTHNNSMESLIKFSSAYIYTCNKFMKYIAFRKILTYTSQKNLNNGMI